MLTGKASRVYKLTRMVVYQRDQGRCRYCGAYVSPDAFEVHHIMHQGPCPHMRYDPDNCWLICRQCHMLDDVGNLLPIIINEIGEDKYYELKRRAQNVVSVDLETTMQYLRQQLEEGVYG